MIEAKQSKFFYGWVIVGISALALLISNGLSIGGIPVFSKPFREEFVESGAVAANQAESMVALAGVITFLMAGFSSPVAGYLIDRFDIRTIMIIGCLVLGLGLIVHSQATTPAMVYVSRAMFGLSLGFVGVLANTVLVSNWFRRLRGTAIGIILTGTSFGGVIIPLVATPLIIWYGWRTAMVVVSMIVWVILLPAVVFLVKSKPSDLGLLPDGDEPTIDKDVSSESELGSTVPKKVELEGLTLGEALRTPIFWVFAVCAALIFYPIFVTTQQFILYVQSDKIGMTAQMAGLAQAGLFAVSVGGKFSFGFLSDRFSPTRVMLACCTVMFLATFMLFGLTATTAFLFLIPFGLGYGGTFVLLQRLAADYFGLKAYGKILGMITVVETIGAAVGGYVTGKLADAAGGDYSQAFYGVVIVTGLALLMVIALNFMVSNRERTAKA